MFDHLARPLLERGLAAAARRCIEAGISADRITLAAFAAGIGAALAVTQGAMWLALALIIVNRALDGLDGIVARLGRPTDLGGFLDITLDFAFYASIPLAFALLDPVRNALPAAALLAAFLLNGTALLAFSVMAERYGLKTEAQGRKSLYFLAGLAEGTETVIAFALMCLLPSWFPEIATAFAILCALSGAARIIVAANRLAHIKPRRPDDGG
ncbi:MAG: CDP-alcohol phosphatidyltransferase family protein [Hyphomicrobiales bacterium]|nr:CDP-alcohol phosphatidyltransferase family protein [Hyphomicrobiales bacterium]